MGTRRTWEAIGLPDGPGSEPRPYSSSAGVLVYVWKHELYCNAQVVVENSGRTPFDKKLPTSCPSLVLASHAMDSDFFAPIEEFWTIFGLPTDHQDGSLEAYANFAEGFLNNGLRDEFGDGVNLAALDDIDVSTLPPLFAAYKSEYYSIFQYNEPFIPARWFGGRAGWNTDVLQRSYDTFESTGFADPAHQLERWWFHASLTVGIEAAHKKLGK